jgi:excisionase family DNA binding protein
MTSSDTDPRSVDGRISIAPQGALAEGQPEASTLDSIRGRATCSVQEAADILGISRWAVYRAVERGEISAIRVGRRILVPTARLLADLEPGLFR